MNIEALITRITIDITLARLEQKRLQLALDNIAGIITDIDNVCREQAKEYTKTFEATRRPNFKPPITAPTQTNPTKSDGT